MQILGRQKRKQELQNLERRNLQLSVEMRELKKQQQLAAWKNKKRSFDVITQSTKEMTKLLYDVSIDRKLDYRLGRLRAYSRDAEMNDPLVRRYLCIMKNSVVGPDGINLQNKAVKSFDDEDQPIYDNVVNNAVEKAWRDFEKPENYSVHNLSAKDIDDMVLQRVAIDGEIFVNIVTDKNSKYGIQIELIEANCLDYEYNDTSRNIIHGTKFDSHNRPIEYYFRKRTDGDRLTGKNQSENFPVPASQLILMVRQDYVEQSRGMPWITCVLVPLRMLKNYQTTSLNAAEYTSRSFGFFTKTGDAFAGGYEGQQPAANQDSDDGSDDTVYDDDESWEMDVPVGSFQSLPTNYDVKMSDPKYPVGNYDPFVTKVTQNVASGMQVSYMLLASDPGDATYSSAKIDDLQNRPTYQSLTTWIIQMLKQPVFGRWLPLALVRGLIVDQYGRKYGFEDLDRINAPVFFGRAFQFHEPLKEANAAMTLVDAGIISKRRARKLFGVFDNEQEIADINSEKASTTETEDLKESE